MKKIIYVLLAFVFLFTLVGCETNDVTTEAKAFKEDYEKLNGTEARNGHTHRVVSIDENNPFVKITSDEIVTKMDNKDSFYLYVGDPKCPWCRSVVETFIKKANEFEIERVYYIRFWDDNYNEVFRDVYELNDNNEPVLEQEATEGYKRLLSSPASNDLLRDYILTNGDGYDFYVGEKRAYGPSYFYIDNGEVKLMIEGTSKKQKNPFEELTDEIIKDEEANFEDFFEKSMSCDERC